MKLLAILLATVMLLVAPTAIAIGNDMDDKPKTKTIKPKTKTILAGPGAKGTSTIGALKELAHSTEIKGFGFRTKLGKGISVSAKIRKRETGKASPNILGGRRGRSPERSTGPHFGIKIKF